MVNMNEAASNGNSQPTIAVDLDGTLISGDMALMSSLEFVRRNPGNLLRLVGWAISGGRLKLKQEVAQRVALDGGQLIWRQDVLTFLRKCKQDGRQLVLATAAMRPHAEAVFAELGLFSDLLCSSEQVNLHSGRKADALDAKYGPGNWEYVGDSPHQDPPVFARAHRSHLVRPQGAMRDSARQIGEVFGEFEPRNLRNSLGLMQPAAWLGKALLGFVIPLAFLSAYWPDFNAAAGLAPLLQALLACCLAASVADVAGALFRLAPGNRAHTNPEQIAAILDITASRCLRIGAALLAGCAVLASTLPTSAAILIACHASLAIIESIWLTNATAARVVAKGLLHTLVLATALAAVGFESFPYLSAAAAPALLLFEILQVRSQK